jgi:hypothetical protein
MGAYGGTAEAGMSFSSLYEKYGGGTGEPNDPYLIYTAEQMNSVGAEPNDWDGHFQLMADLDLSAFSYYAAPIAPDTDTVREDFQGTPFTGVFDGNGHTISHLTITGESYLGLFGKLDSGATILNLGLEAVDVTGTGNVVGGLAGANGGTIMSSHSTGAVTGNEDVGSLVGYNGYGSITDSHSAATVSGDKLVGGLVGYNRYGSITSSYSTGTVTGDDYVGGLLGVNDGGSSVAGNYSTGTVSGNKWVGGLAGTNWSSSITGSYSTGAVTGNYYVGGLVGENRGVITESFWDTETSGQATSAAGTGKTTSEMQTGDTFLDAGWDFIDETANGTEDIWWILEGQDYPRLWWELPIEYPVLVVDDFESYNDIEEGQPGSNRIYLTWIAPFTPGNEGAIVGHLEPPFTEQTIVHSGSQSMPFYYDNTNERVNSWTCATFFSSQDWTTNRADTLSLWLRGDAGNGIDAFYITVHEVTLFHPDPNAVVIDTWTQWLIPLSDLTAAGVDVTRIRFVAIGVGDKTKPSQNACGILYIDDITVTKRMPLW